MNKRRVPLLLVFLSLLVLVVPEIAYSVSVNDGFDPNPNGTIYSITTRADGKILIGGNFTTVGGVTSSRIARLNPDGSLDPALVRMLIMTFTLLSFSLMERY